MLGLGTGINKLSAAEAAAIAGRLPGFTGLLDETFGATAEAAYSVRQLSGSQSVAMTIRRDSDNAETGIGFDSNGNLDEAAIETFCTGTVCKVSSWKDQSGNGNDATQSTAANQPTIYTGGQLVKEGGRLALNFDITDRLTNSMSVINQPITVFNILSVENYGAVNYAFDSGYTTGDRVFIGVNTSNDWRYFAGSTINTSTSVAFEQTVLTGLFDSGNSEFFLNGLSVSTGNAGSNGLSDLVIGNKNDGTNFSIYGNMQELILYDADKSSDRTDIEENIGDYYTQNTPLLDTYTGAAAAYSLRKIRSDYSGNAVKVRRASDNVEADIGFNVFKELDTVALAAHCGSSDGFVSVWYDQSSSNNATQTTAANQPKIYDGTTGVITESGKPSMDMSAGLCHLYYDSVVLSQPLSFFMTGNNGSQNYAAFFDSYNDTTNRVRFFDGGLIRDVSAGTSLSYTSSSNVYAVRSAIVDSTNSSVHFNGSQKASGDAGTNDYRFGRIGNFNASNGTQIGKLQEFIIYESNQSDNRTDIEDNINTFYNIY